MTKTHWITKVKDYLLAAACTALVSVVLSGVAMLLRHDKKIDLLDFKMNIVLKHVAPEVDIPTISDAPVTEPSDPNRLAHKK